MTDEKNVETEVNAEEVTINEAAPAEPTTVESSGNDDADDSGE